MCPFAKKLIRRKKNGKEKKERRNKYV